MNNIRQSPSHLALVKAGFQLKEKFCISQNMTLAKYSNGVTYLFKDGVARKVDNLMVACGEKSIEEVHELAPDNFLMRINDGTTFHLKDGKTTKVECVYCITDFTNRIVGAPWYLSEDDALTVAVKNENAPLCDIEYIPVEAVSLREIFLP